MYTDRNSRYARAAHQARVGPRAPGFAGRDRANEERSEMSLPAIT